MVKGKVRNSINYSIKDGICWSVMVGFVEPYIVPFALTLGANNIMIGLIRSLPSLISSFSQIISQTLVYIYRSCKKIVYYSVFIQALSVFFVSFTVLDPTGYSVYIFLILIIIYTFSGSLATAPWFTLMGEYLPPDKRGRFFGFRTQIIGLFYFISSFLASYLLKENPNNKMLFLYIFLLASFFRFCSAYYITKMYEPEKLFHIPKEKSDVKIFLNFSIEPKIKKIYLSIFILLFSTYIAAPYFSVYVLKELKFDYIRYMFVVSFGLVLTWLTAPFWGRMNDKIGSVKTLKYAFIFIPFISLMWMLTKNFYLLLTVEIFSGIVWGAFGLVYNTFVYEYVKPQDRTKYTSYLIFFMSIAQFLGSITGGIIYDKFSISEVSTFIILLGLSTMGRFIALVYFIRLTKN
ncbi:MAG: MFS transporter [Elusimicrobiales bacterium]